MLALVTTHPIQYQVPYFRALGERIDLTVYYDHLPDAEAQGTNFGQAFEWDLPLLDGYDWRVREGGSDAPAGAQTFASLRRATARADAVLVLGWHVSYMRQATLWAAVQRQPLLVRGISNALQPRPWPVKALHWAYLRLFDRYLYVGHANAKFYRQYGLPARRMHPARYFVENSRFDADYQRLREERGAVRGGFDVPEEATCLLFVGKFIEKKRPLWLLDAFQRLRARTDASVHLLMVGSGELLSEAQRVAGEHDLPVTFTGFMNQTEIGRAYTAADALVLPSNYGETWGAVVNEAMIFETPALVSDRVGSGPDLVTNGETGYVFPFEEQSALVEAMATIAERPEQRIEMGTQARRRVMNDYSIEKAVEGTLEAVEAACSHRG